VDQRDASVTAAPSVDRLTAAAARSYGAIRAISNCARGGLLSPASERELNDVYTYRVEPLLRSASLLQKSAALLRLLVTVVDRIGP
jgi:hypothetical protein